MADISQHVKKEDQDGNMATQGAITVTITSTDLSTEEDNEDDYMSDGGTASMTTACMVPHIKDDGRDESMRGDEGAPTAINLHQPNNCLIACDGSKQPLEKSKATENEREITPSVPNVIQHPFSEEACGWYDYWNHHRSLPTIEGIDQGIYVQLWILGCWSFLPELQNYAARELWYSNHRQLQLKASDIEMAFKSTPANSQLRMLIILMYAYGDPTLVPREGVRGNLYLTQFITELQEFQNYAIFDHYTNGTQFSMPEDIEDLSVFFVEDDEENIEEYEAEEDEEEDEAVLQSMENDKHTATQGEYLQWANATNAFHLKESSH